jgi:hypothetical protein
LRAAVENLNALLMSALDFSATPSVMHKDSMYLPSFSNNERGTKSRNLLLPREAFLSEWATEFCLLSLEEQGEVAGKVILRSRAAFTSGL